MPMRMPRSAHGDPDRGSLSRGAVRSLAGVDLVRERAHRLRCPGATWRWVPGMSGPGPQSCINTRPSWGGRGWVRGGGRGGEDARA